MLTMQALPKRTAGVNRRETSFDALYWRLNDPRRFPTPQVIVEALMYSLRERGEAALKEPNCQRRLSDLSTEQVREVIERLARLQSKYPNVTNGLLLTLGELLP